MKRDQNRISVGEAVVALVVLLNVATIKQGWISHPKWYSLLYLTLPLLLLCLIRFY